jgi:hypothetical protein
MTACIAAISDNGKKLVIAVDNMLTHNAGVPVQRTDAAHEKMVQLTDDGIYAMAAGANLVIHPVIDEVLQKRPVGSPKEVAEIVRTTLQEFYLRKVEEEILKIFNLDWPTFTQSQSQLSPQVLNDIHSRIQNFSLDINIIVAGIDQGTGEAHVSVISGNGISLDRTSDGVISIGSGGTLAAVSMILSNYTKNQTASAVEKLVKKAMKDAKRTPGVGDLGKLVTLPV